MPVPGSAPDWVCIVFVFGIFVALPLDAWLRAWPSAVKNRNSRVKPAYRHDIKGEEK